MTYFWQVLAVMVLMPLACANAYLYFSGRGSYINIFAACTCAVAAILQFV